MPPLNVGSHQEIIQWGHKPMLPADPRARQVRQETPLAPGYDQQMRTLSAIEQALSGSARDLSRSADAMATFAVGPLSVQRTLRDEMDGLNTTIAHAARATLASFGAGQVSPQPGVVDVPIAPAAAGPTPIGLTPTGPVAPVHAPRGRTESPASRGEVPPLRGMGGGPEGMVRPRRGGGGGDQWGGGYRDEAWRPSMRTIHERFGQKLTQWATTGHESDIINAGTDEAPQWVHRTPGAVAGAPTTPASHDEVAKMQQSARRRNKIAQLGEAIGEEKGTMGVLGAILPAGALEAVSGVGMAVAVGQQVAHFAEGQREANAPWQRISGGGQMAAYGERGRERAFQFGLMGTMGSAQASQLFEGVSEMGLTGADRGRALDFAVDKFRDYGMRITDSLTLINAAMKDGTLSFGELSKSLDQVTEAAKRAGMNTDEARQAFTQSLQSLSPMVGGEAANALAASFASNMARLGHQYAGVGFGMDENMMRRMAAQNNMSYGQFVGTANAPGGAAFTARSVQQMGRQQMTNMLGGPNLAQLQAIARRRGYGNDLTKLSGAQMELVGNELLQQGNLDPSTITTLLSQMGVTGVTNQNLGGSMVAAATGKIGPNPEGFKPKVVGEPGQANLGAVGKAIGDKTLSSDIAIYNEAGGMNRGDAARSVKDRTRLFYGMWVQKTGKTSPTIEKMIDAGYTRQDLFEVQTPGGARQVNFEEALQYYPDQLARGEAKLVKGSGRTHAEKEGTLVSEISGVGGDQDVQVTSSATGKTVGKVFDETKWQADQDKKAAKAGDKGTLLVEASPALQNLIRLSGSGVSVSYGPSGGNPPTNGLGTGKTGVR